MKLWYKTGDVTLLQDISRSSVLCLDVETTGLDSHTDEVLQIALLRGDGETLLSQRVRPERRLSWPSAQRIHGISPAMVEGCPSLASVKPKIEKAFEDAGLIVGYNVTFDLLFLQAAGIPIGKVPVFDVMREFAPVAGRWDAGRQRYAWVPLACCAKHYGVPLRAHDALEDARATMECFWVMLGRVSNRRQSPSSESYLDVAARCSRAKLYGRGGKDE